MGVDGAAITVEDLVFGGVDKRESSGFTNKGSDSKDLGK